MCKLIYPVSYTMAPYSTTSNCPNFNISLTPHQSYHAQFSALSNKLHYTSKLAKKKRKRGDKLDAEEENFALIQERENKRIATSDSVIGLI